MKWNAIITKSQYEKAVKRTTELSHNLPGSSEEDELTLLLMLIKDYENRQNEMLGQGFKNQIFQGSFREAVEPLSGDQFRSFVNKCSKYFCNIRTCECDSSLPAYSNVIIL